MDSQKQLFTIQQLSFKLDIPKPTLRFWEKELDGIIVPIRTRGKQRRYNLEHLTIIGKVKELREKGMSLSEIKYKLGNSKKIRGNNSDSDTIDLLADHIAEIVKAGVYNFFEK
ncbi:MAG: MerR family transcriptional regulator [Deltaproteobacteria bacterium]|nr:MerR family transcriptional regulator [Deltaproteobacteria bacterium]